MQAGCPHRIEVPVGTGVITFNEKYVGGALDGVRIALTGIADADFAQDVSTMDKKPAAHGGNLQGGYSDALYPTLSGEIQAPSLAALVATNVMLRNYLASIRKANGDGSWYWTEEGQGETYLTPVNVFGPGYSPDPLGVLTCTFTIALQVSDPTIYSS